MTCSTSVPRLLGAAAVGGPATLARAAAAGQLAVGLGGREPPAFRALLGLDHGRGLDGGEEALDRPPGAADLVHPLGHRGAGVAQLAVAVPVDRAEGLVHLDELAVRQPADDPGLAAVLQHLAV